MTLILKIHLITIGTKTLDLPKNMKLHHNHRHKLEIKDKNQMKNGFLLIKNVNKIIKIKTKL